MFNVIIADDEPKFREYLRNCIPWNEVGFDLVGEAKNGLEVLEIVQDTQVDLVLLDINMPSMDGLAVSESLKSQNKAILIVLITGHSEFEYAQRALKLGVEDYILKPFNREQMLELLGEFKERLLKVKAKDIITKKEEHLVRDSFILKMVFNEISYSEEIFKQYFERFNLPTSTPYYSVATIELLNTFQDSQEENLWQFTIKNILEEMTDLNGEKIIINGFGGKIISIFNYGQEENVMASGSGSYLRVQQYAKKYFNINLGIGIGRPYKGLHNIYKSYEESLRALQNARTYSEEGIYNFKLDEDAIITGFYDVAYNDRILNALRMQDFKSIETELEALKKYILESKVSTEYIQAIVLGLVSSCLSFIKEMNIEPKEILGEAFQPITGIQELRTISQIFNWLSDIYSTTILFFSKGKTTRAKVIVAAVRKYIDEHFMETSLRVEDIASHLYLDTSYIRKVLAKEMNTSVIELITTKRMEKAHEILIAEPIRLSDLAQRVGYNDPRYFSKCYKKFYGLSPSEFTNLISAD